MRIQLNDSLRNEKGVTALETAIILIAFVVVAAIFSFTVLSTGTFMTERSKDAAFGGLEQVRGSMELKGSVVLENNGIWVVLDLAMVAGGSAVDMTKVTILYRDASNRQEVTLGDPTCIDLTAPGGDYTWNATSATGTALANCILQSGQVAKIWVNLGAQNALVAHQSFTLEIKPATGGTLLVQRTTPESIDTITDLY